METKKKKIVFYTRIENDTGGDEAVLNILHDSFSSNMASYEVYLCLVYDAASKARARRIEQRWREDCKNAGVDFGSFLFKAKKELIEDTAILAEARYAEFDNKSQGFQNTFKTLDPRLTWIMKNKHDGNLYIVDSRYIDEDSKKPGIELHLAEDESLDTQYVQCYAQYHADSSSSGEDGDQVVKGAGVAPKAKKTQFPLFSLAENKVRYYASAEVAALQFAIDPTAVKNAKYSALATQIKTKNIIMKLNEDDLSAILSCTRQVPDELKLKDSDWAKIAKSETSPCRDIIAHREAWFKFQEACQSASIFVFAGWAHLHTSKTATYLKDVLKIPEDCRFLLCSQPGSVVNSLGLEGGMHAAFKKENVFAYEPGVDTELGLPLLSALTREMISLPDYRQQWIAHSTLNDLAPKLSLESRCDQLIVIYCSKDKINSDAQNLLNKIKKEIECSEKQLIDYRLILVGTNQHNKTAWESHIKLAFPGCQCLFVERTANSGILMRGFHDAEYGMATGAFTILEAYSLGIWHCEYWAPPHMKGLSQMLSVRDDAGKQRIGGAIARGRHVMAALSSSFWREDYDGGDLYAPYMTGSPNTSRSSEQTLSTSSSSSDVSDSHPSDDLLYEVGGLNGLPFVSNKVLGSIACSPPRLSSEGGFFRASSSAPALSAISLSASASSSSGLLPSAPSCPGNDMSQLFAFDELLAECVPDDIKSVQDRSNGLMGVQYDLR